MSQGRKAPGLQRLDPIPLFVARKGLKHEFMGRAIDWEMCVYNAGAIRLDGLTYVLYRALGRDGVSRLGLWTTRDGVTQESRLGFPVFGPVAEYEMPPDPLARMKWHREEFGMVREVGGTEDPRLVLVGDTTIIMTYTAYGDIGRLAAATIDVEEFKAAARSSTSYAQWLPLWKRLGLVFVNEMDKDAYILPEKHNGQWVLYHRIHPDIQVVLLDDLRFPLDDTGPNVLSPRPDRWDCDKIGGGADALKTELGWLHIYHGVGVRHGRRAYMLGSFVTALDDPARVIYRSDEPILVPEEDCELHGWVPDVVFTCGVVPVGKDSTETLAADDEIIVYYGGADEVMCAARGTVGELAGR